MPLPALGALTVAVVALLVVVRELVAAVRGSRPPRQGLVLGLAAVAVCAVVLAWATGFSISGLAGMPRRYATYRPEQSIGPLLLVPLLGVGLILGGCIGVVRSGARPDVERAALSRAWHRVIAGLVALLGVALVGIGLVEIALRHR